ncbi:MAG: DUF349 domain-containing protein [Xanthomonadales bacterium]|nr:DUF349 domain-containing protein [Xanthomonadales bacterium]
MSLFDSIKPPKWQHKNPEVRQQALSELDDQALLLELVYTDPDPSVQLAALARIDQAQLLDELIGKKLSQVLHNQARLQRLQLLLPQSTGLQAGLATISDETTLLHIIDLSDDLELTTTAIERIESEQTRAELARVHPVAKARLHAAQSIRSLAVLEQLMQSSKGHDKAIFRHCKNLLDEAHALEKRAAEQQEKIRRLSAQIEELAKSLDSPIYEGQYRSLVLEWQSVESAASSAQKASFQRDQAICGQRLILLREERADAERNQAEVAMAREQFPAILSEFDEFEVALTTPSDPNSLQSLDGALKEFESRWQESHQISPAPTELAGTFKARVQALRTISGSVKKLLEKAGRANALLNQAKKLDGKNYGALEKHIKELKKFLGALSWPETSRLEIPEAIGHLQVALQALGKQLNDLDQDQPKLTARLRELTETLSLALDQERPKASDRALTKARKLLISLVPKTKQQFEQELGPLTARLNEFHDWQNFAIEPKKEELCGRMSALIGNPDDVELLALNIQTLQTEWKQLGPLPHARENELWTRFKAAADEAWKPCKEAFDLQAQTRRENFAERMKLVDQLKAYEAQMGWPDAVRDELAAAGPKPDWPVVQKTLDAARATFRTFEPVDPKGDRTSQKAFREICDRIYGHIHAEYQRNIERKETLLKRAKELADVADLQQAMATAKQLQVEWKDTGKTPVAVDRKLWKGFRASCDAVFARLDQERVAQQSEAQAQVKQAEALRDQARALLQNPETETIAQLPRSVSELKAEMTAIDLPVPVRLRLYKDFEAMERQARDSVNQARKQLEQESWAQLVEIMLISSKAGPESQADSVPDDTWNNLPKGVDAGILREFSLKGPDEDGDEKCREACIALEVFGEIESPTEDKQARMNYQLNRLTQGLGNQTSERAEALLGHINAFIATRPTTPWVKRFCSSLDKIRN